MTITTSLTDAHGNRYTLDSYGDRVYVPMVYPLHFHIETSGRDCDGGHGNESIQFGWGDDTGRLAWNAYVAMMVTHHANEPGWRMTRRTLWDGTAELEFGGPTDEGFSMERAYTCTDNCRGRQTYVYDEFAQAAGY